MARMGGKEHLVSKAKSSGSKIPLAEYDLTHSGRVVISSDIWENLIQARLPDIVSSCFPCH